MKRNLLVKHAVKTGPRHHKLLEVKSRDLKVLWSSMISLIGAFAKIVAA